MPVWATSVERSIFTLKECLQNYFQEIKQAESGHAAKQPAFSCKHSVGSLAWIQYYVRYSLRSLARSWLRAIVCPTGMSLFTHRNILMLTVFTKIGG